MTLQPLNDHVLVRLEKPERMSASKLLFIPQNAKRQAHELYEATVLAVGPGLRRHDNLKHRPCEIEVGQKVLVYWAGVEMETPEYGPDTRVIREGLIQAVLS